MIVSIAKWGNSHAIRIPKEILEKAKLGINDKIEIFSHFISKVEHEINPKNGAHITKIEVVDIQFAKEKLKEDDKTKASQNNKPLNKQK